MGFVVTIALTEKDKEDGKLQLAVEKRSEAKAIILAVKAKGNKVNTDQSRAIDFD